MGIAFANVKSVVGNGGQFLVKNHQTIISGATAAHGAVTAVTQAKETGIGAAAIRLGGHMGMAGQLLDDTVVGDVAGVPLRVAGAGLTAIGHVVHGSRHGKTGEGVLNAARSLAQNAASTGAGLVPGLAEVQTVQQIASSGQGDIVTGAVSKVIGPISDVARSDGTPDAGPGKTPPVAAKGGAAQSV